MSKIFNRRIQKEYRKRLRDEMPVAERSLWSCLRGRQLSGYKFRRQHGVGPYIVDFYCPEEKLVIEIDGDSHFEIGAEKRDEERQKFIETQGIKVLRFTNNDIRDSVEDVVKIIIEHLKGNPS